MVVTEIIRTTSDLVVVLNNGKTVKFRCEPWNDPNWDGDDDDWYDNGYILFYINELNEYQVEIFNDESGIDVDPTLGIFKRHLVKGWYLD